MFLVDMHSFWLLADEGVGLSYRIWLDAVTTTICSLSGFLMAITDKWLNVDVTGGGLLSLSSVEILCDAALPVKLA